MSFIYSQNLIISLNQLTYNPHIHKIKLNKIINSTQIIFGKYIGSGFVSHFRVQVSFWYLKLN